VTCKTTVIMLYVRWIYLKRKNKNAELRELLGLEPVSLVIKKCRLRWYGHVERKVVID